MLERIYIYINPGEEGLELRLRGFFFFSLTRWREPLERRGQERGVSVVGRRVRDVGVDKGLEDLGAEDAVHRVLDVAAQLVLLGRVELGMADRWEVEDLGDDAC